VRRLIRWVVRGPLLLVAIAVAWSLFQVVAVRFYDPPATMTMVGRAFESLGDGKGLRWPARRVVDLKDLGPSVPRAVLSAEDAKFYLHHGFDWDSICDALDHSGKRGASTITQQTAKNLFLWQGRSWVRKGLEVWYTVLLELLVPKDRILELYLNAAETGPMVFGLEAGAEYHFGKHASQLTPSEAARLASILPNPREWSTEGSAARDRAAWIQQNPAPIPGDRAWTIVLRDWDSRYHGPWSCLF
jgi:monofunctional biosynthetic peptidoglycan transglycosylase